MKLSAYVCPDCGGDLRSQGEATIECSQCGGSWPTRLGVPIFSDPDFYYGELPRDEMQDALAPGPTRINEVRQNLAKRDEWLPTYAFATNRVDWRVPLGVAHGGRVLDYGCGLGAVSMGLAPHFEQVCSVDPAPERAAMLALRAEADGRDNVAAAAADIDSIPFPKASFDVVVVMGVLEWTPLSYPDLTPREAELTQLRKLSEYLRPGGTLVLGIENRIGIRYFIGGREEHSNLRFVSLLPRRLADIYSERVGKGPYRNWTYSAPGTVNLLKDAGFEAPKPFGTWFHYSFPDLTYPMDLESSQAARIARGLPGAVNEHWRNFKGFGAIKAGFERSRGFRRLAPSLLLTARKPGGGVAPIGLGADTHEVVLPSRNDRPGLPMRTVRFVGDRVEETARSRDEAGADRLRDVARVLEDHQPNAVVPAVRGIEEDAGDTVIVFDFVDGERASVALGVEPERTTDFVAAVAAGLAELAVEGVAIPGSEAAKEAAEAGDALDIDTSALSSALEAVDEIPTGLGHVRLDLDRVIMGRDAWIVTDWDTARNATAPFEGLIDVARLDSDASGRRQQRIVEALESAGVERAAADAALRLAVVRRAAESGEPRDVDDARGAARAG